MLQALAARLTPPWSRTARNSSKRCSVSPGFIIVFTLLIQSISRLCPIHKSAQDCRYSGAFHDRCRAAARRGASPLEGVVKGEVLRMYQEGAGHPEGQFHFYHGRRAAEMFGYASDWPDRAPGRAGAAVAGG